MSDEPLEPKTDQPEARDQDTFGKKIGRAIAQSGQDGWLFATMLFTLSCILFLVLVYFIWLKLIPFLWAWGADPISYRIVLSLIAIIYAAILPGIAPMLFIKGIDLWNEYKAAQMELGDARKKQDNLQSQLDVNDPQYPVKLVSYSRFMLQEYYIMAMKQAQRSFKYCLIAMWLGFFVLLIGVADYFLPMQSIFAKVMDVEIAQTTEFSAQSFVLITGVVLEFISVAFLWVYRFSIKQQTYYYRRQLKLHNVLIAKNITESMEAGKDAALTSIITNLLENVEMTQIAPPKTDALKGLAPSS